jgi:hypothetical protein
MPLSGLFVGRATQLRPLPLSVRPVADETPASYLRRLARTNQLDAHQLELALKTPTRRWTPHLVDHLATLGGQTPTALRYGRWPVGLGPASSLRSSAHSAAADAASP